MKDYSDYKEIVRREDENFVQTIGMNDFGSFRIAYRFKDNDGSETTAYVCNSEVKAMAKALEGLK